MSEIRNVYPLLVFTLIPPPPQFAHHSGHICPKNISLTRRILYDVNSLSLSNWWDFRLNVTKASEGDLNTESWLAWLCSDPREIYSQIVTVYWWRHNCTQTTLTKRTMHSAEPDEILRDEKWKEKTHAKSRYLYCSPTELIQFTSSYAEYLILAQPCWWVSYFSNPECPEIGHFNL